VVVEDDLRARARSFREAVGSRHRDFDVLFASKAFPCSAVYKALAEEGLACDVASGGELHLALKAGFDPARVYLHGNAKSEDELRAALHARVGHVVLDSFDDIARLERVCAETGRRQEVLVRVTPGVSGDTHHAMSTGQADSKFGFSIGDAKKAIQRLATAELLELVGLHCHIGSQLFELSSYRAAAALLADFAASAGGDELRVMNMGGGLGIAYSREDRPPAVEEYAETVMGAVAEEWARVGLPRPQVAVEPGRSVVGRAGLNLYRVGTVKHIPGVRTYAAVDGGMSDLIRPMLYGARYEVLVANRADAEATTTLRLVGKHCESGDVLAQEAVLPEVEVGDLVCLPATGAYGVAMASNYNGVPRPAVVFVDEGRSRLVTRRETLAEIVARDL
jgi:diaminopimelate decarboxylase